jgi:hypothetical protein
MSRFDWYATTLCDDPTPPLTAVQGLVVLGDHTRPVRGLYGYSRGWEIAAAGDVIATCYEAPGRPDFVVSKGHHAHDFAESFRNIFPGGSVSRADSAIDFSGGGAFYEMARDWAIANLPQQVRTREWSDPRSPETGRTLYIGSRTSEVFGRIYEKGKQDPTYAPDTVRAEIEVKPNKAHRKRYAASASADDLWGFGRWSRTLASELLSVGAPAAPPRSARVSDLDKALDTVVTQYRRTFLDHLQRLDGDVDAWSTDLLNRFLER